VGVTVIDCVQNLRRALGMLEPLGWLPLEIERLRLQIGRAEAARVRALPPGAPLADAEFQVFSQFGEDGISQHLVAKVPIENDVFIEFGYWGASPAALTRTANAKGFSLVGSNNAGNNAFLARDDVVGQLPVLDAGDAWRPSRFRELRGPTGELTYVSDRMVRLRLTREMSVLDLDAGATLTIGERLGV
jgi:hypothetical protein